jgi:hypothetical protein
MVPSISGLTSEERPAVGEAFIVHSVFGLLREEKPALGKIKRFPQFLAT